MVVQLAHAPLPVAPAVGTLSLAFAGGVRGQGLGIPWPLLGCPCRLPGRLNILEFSTCLGCGGSAVAVDVPAGAVHHRSCSCALVETFFCCSSWTWLTCPLLCIAKCAVIAVCCRHPCRGAEADSYAFLSFSYCSTLIRWSSSLVQVLLWETVEFPQLQPFPDKVVDMPVVLDDYSLWFHVQKTAKVPQLLRVVMVADVPVVQVVWCRFLRLWTPCDHAATRFSSTVEVPQSRSSPEFMDILLCNREWLDFQAYWLCWRCRVFAHFAPFFALLRVVRELSASFLSPRRRRVLRCRGSPCQFMTLVLWTYTH